MATETHPVAHAAATPKAVDSTSPPFILEAVNNARVALGKNALSKVECEAALNNRPKPAPQQKVDPKSDAPPPVPEFIESEAQFLVDLPANYVHPTLDEGRMKTTPPAATRS